MKRKALIGTLMAGLFLAGIFVPVIAGIIDQIPSARVVRVEIISDQANAWIGPILAYNNAQSVPAGFHVGQIVDFDCPTEYICKLDVFSRTDADRIRVRWAISDFRVTPTPAPTEGKPIQQDPAICVTFTPYSLEDCGP
jgi:hypothetical protein